MDLSGFRLAANEQSLRASLVAKSYQPQQIVFAMPRREAPATFYATGGRTAINVRRRRPSISKNRGRRIGQFGR